MTGSDALADHVGDPASQGARLARAGSGQDEDRTGVGDHGCSLLRIERSQIKHWGPEDEAQRYGVKGHPKASRVFPRNLHLSGDSERGITRDQARRSRMEASKSATTSPRGFAPTLPLPCRRTLTTPASRSRWPTTSMV